MRPDSETVPFGSRADLLSDLLAWCTTDSATVDLRLLSGPGGQGKTRLARHLAQILANGPHDGSRRWLTGFLDPDPGGTHASGVERIADTAGPVLVVDYAETRGDQVEALWAADSMWTARVLLVLDDALDHR